MNRDRVYLDWNATAPLRAEARDAMLAAMDVVGNPSSVHAEGRRARAIVEHARGQVAALAGVDRNEVVFTSGATEAAALAVAGRSVICADVEHDAVRVHQGTRLEVQANGEVCFLEQPAEGLFAVQAANSETGVLQHNIKHAQTVWRFGLPVLVDAVQLAGKFDMTLGDLGADYVLLSAHKIGGPKGVGALCLKLGMDVEAAIPGGGQEQGRRSGTENVVGIAGFGAAAAAAQRDQAAGLWEALYDERNHLEARLAEAAPDAIFAGQGAPRLTNTSCFAVPGWKGETQVMQMDLAGFAISAGSACSSGKVRASRVLRAMGYDEITASSAIRVSLGPTTTRDQIDAFADAWIAQYHKFKARAA